jgi:hypothetical protein
LLTKEQKDERSVATEVDQGDAAGQQKNLKTIV